MLLNCCLTKTIDCSSYTVVIFHSEKRNSVFSIEGRKIKIGILRSPTNCQFKWGQKVIHSAIPYSKSLHHKTTGVPKGKEEENSIPLTWSPSAQLQHQLLGFIFFSLSTAAKDLLPNRHSQGLLHPFPRLHHGQLSTLGNCCHLSARLLSRIQGNIPLHLAQKLQSGTDTTFSGF